MTFLTVFGGMNLELMNSGKGAMGRGAVAGSEPEISCSFVARGDHSVCMPINILDAPDANLLRRYAAERDEMAFAELVRRHLPLVFSAAARKLDSRSSAEDISQAVFVQLAKNAQKLAAHPVLAGWLYTTASRLSAEFSRKQARRQKREEQAMQTEPDHTNPQVEWSELRPVLDLAMEGLPEEDRHSIILRYFEGRDFSSVGRELGLSADAARMRVTRGLERLRDVLKRYRITSTIIALDAVLAERSVEAVPASVALSVTQSVRILSVAGKAPVALSGAKILAVAAALLLVLGGAQVFIRRGAQQEHSAKSGASTVLQPGEPPGETTTRLLLGRPPISKSGPTDPALAEALEDLRAALFDIPLGLPERSRLLRVSAGKLVGKEGETITLFREALNSANPEVASMAIEALGHFGELPRQFGDELLRVLENPDFKESVGLIANRLLPSMLVAENAVPTLLSLLERRPDLKEQIAYLLTTIIPADRPGLAAHRQAVEALLQHAEPSVQSAARDLLAELPQPPPLPNPEVSSRLAKLLGSSAETDRRRAFLELWKISSLTPEIRDALATLMRKDPSPQTRLEARLELSRFMPNDPAFRSDREKGETSQSLNAAAQLSVPELLGAIADRGADIPQLVHRLAETDNSFWNAHPAEKMMATSMLASLHRDRDAKVYEAVVDAYAQFNRQPRMWYAMEELTPFFGVMESSLSPGEYAIAIRDLRSSLLSYWKAHGFIQPEPTHLPADLVKILFVGPYHENRPAYDQMLNAMRREVDRSFQPPEF